MSATWTTEQVIALSPDASSTKNGQKLANVQKWVSLGRNELAIWGECKGSGKNPYRTQIDLSEPAFKCSCPSRKFPCKHSLGLFLLFASQPNTFSETALPDWVEKWLNSRAQRQQKSAEKKSAVDPEAQAKRIAKREAKVKAGLEELELWLRDLVRQGLAAAQAQPYSFWEASAARMVDAQAPGLAGQLREMAGIPYSGDGWQERLLGRLGRLHLVLEGYKRLESLPPGTQADLRTLVGWTTKQEELFHRSDAETLADRWLIVGKQIVEEDKLRLQRTWLWGEISQRAALILSFAYGNQPLDISLVPGTVIEADLVFFKSAYPLRALVKTRHGDPTQIEKISGYATIAEAIAAYTQALAKHPWIEQFPVSLSCVTPLYRNGHWFVQDHEGHSFPLSSRFDRGWQLLALSGGHTVALFGEWTEDKLVPLSVCAEGRFWHC